MLVPSEAVQVIIMCSQVGTAAPVKKQGCLHGCLLPILSQRAPHAGTCSADAVL